MNIERSAERRVLLTHQHGGPGRFARSTQLGNSTFPRLHRTEATNGEQRRTLRDDHRGHQRCIITKHSDGVQVRWCVGGVVLLVFPHPSPARMENAARKRPSANTRAGGRGGLFTLKYARSARIAGTRERAVRAANHTVDTPEKERATIECDAVFKSLFQAVEDVLSLSPFV